MQVSLGSFLARKKEANGDIIAYKVTITIQYYSISIDYGKTGLQVTFYHIMPVHLLCWILCETLITKTAQGLRQ